MTALYAEVAVAQLAKTGEELCGDKVEISRTDRATTVVLSDGLGSGVKANILATLTTKIASSLLRREVPLPEVVNTIAQTLPVCRERKIAYSTLHIVKILPSGEVRIVEFDCPPSFLLRGGKVVSIPTHEKLIAGKIIHEGSLELQEDDVVVAVSDGVVHAGIGGLLKLGWNWQGIAGELAAPGMARNDAEIIAGRLLSCCNGYYMGRPGDDSTVVVVKIRRPRQLTLLTGPPANRDMDELVVKRFIRSPGRRVIAGGTTANIVGRVTGRPVRVELTYDDPEVPPVASIEGIDLTTEGVLTLTAATARLARPQALRGLERRDGATMLARLLLEADNIEVLAGTAVNPAHQNPNFPSQINIKGQVLGQLREKLEALGKQVTIEWV